MATTLAKSTSYKYIMKKGEEAFKEKLQDIKDDRSPERAQLNTDLLAVQLSVAHSSISGQDKSVIINIARDIRTLIENRELNPNINERRSDNELLQQQAKEFISTIKSSKALKGSKDIVQQLSKSLDKYCTKYENVGIQRKGVIGGDVPPSYSALYPDSISSEPIIVDKPSNSNPLEYSRADTKLPGSSLHDPNANPPRYARIDPNPSKQDPNLPKYSALDQEKLLSAQKQPMHIGMLKSSLLILESYVNSTYKDKIPMDQKEVIRTTVKEIESFIDKREKQGNPDKSANYSWKADKSVGKISSDYALKESIGGIIDILQHNVADKKGLDKRVIKPLEKALEQYHSKVIQDIEVPNDPRKLKPTMTTHSLHIDLQAGVVKPSNSQRRHNAQRPEPSAPTMDEINRPVEKNHSVQQQNNSHGHNKFDGLDHKSIDGKMLSKRKDVMQNNRHNGHAKSDNNKSRDGSEKGHDQSKSNTRFQSMIREQRSNSGRMR